MAQPTITIENVESIAFNGISGEFLITVNSEDNGDQQQRIVRVNGEMKVTVMNEHCVLIHD